MENLLKYVSTIRSSIEFFFARIKLRVYRGLVVAMFLIYFQISLPSHAESNLANQGYYPTVCVTRNIKAGSIILMASDLISGRRERDKPSVNSVFSPLEILGCKAKRDLRRNQVVTYQDLDFKARMDGSLDIATTLKLAEQLSIARKKWSSLSDAYWEIYAPGESKYEHEGGAVVIATKLIEKGSWILEPSDIERIIVPLSHIPGGAIGSPFRAIGSRAKYDIPKGAVISMQSLVLNSRLSNNEKSVIRKQLALAAQKWKGISVDEFLKE